MSAISKDIAPVGMKPAGQGIGGIKGRLAGDWSAYMTGIIYGEHGKGKTYLAGSAYAVEGMRDVLFINAEAGERGLKQLRSDGIADLDIDMLDHMMVIDVTSYDQLPPIEAFVRKHIAFRDKNDIEGMRDLQAQIMGYTKEQREDKEAIKEVIPEPMIFNTIIFDSLSEIQQYCMHARLGIDTDNHNLAKEPDSAQFQDWGVTRDMIKILVRRFRDLPIHAFFTAGENVEQDAMKANHHDVKLPGQLPGDVRGLVDIVGYLDTRVGEDGQSQRVLYLEGGNYQKGRQVIQAKHRFGDALSGVGIQEPSMQKLYDLDNEVGSVESLGNKTNVEK